MDPGGWQDATTSWPQGQSGWPVSQHAGVCAGSSDTPLLLPHGLPLQTAAMAMLDNPGLSQQFQQYLQQSQSQPQAGSVICLCDPRTEDECLQRLLLGLPGSQTQIVRGIVPELSLLFLFNVRTRLLFGVFRATSWPQLNIEPSAWSEDAGTSRYPLQIRIRLDTADVLQIPEERFRSLVDYHGSFNRFDLRLGASHANALVQLFRQFGVPRQAAPAANSGSYSRSATNAMLHTDGGAGRQQRFGRTSRNGLVFICDSSTEEECLVRQLLGLPS
mmetsp:Transcript_35405/g.58644  ORF Transcript_35405/g.58644 Transcript_35405/m.58644 type:complete len:274 (-) Transcript_35405:1072-1893(-)